MTSLLTLARTNLDRAYSLLGSRPDGSLDIRISPTNPISAQWNIEGLSPCGKAWLARFQPDRAVIGNRELARFKRDLTEWNLSWEVDWSIVTIERSDP